MWSIFSQIFTIDMEVRYHVYFVSLNPDLYSAAITAVVYKIQLSGPL